MTIAGTPRLCATWNVGGDNHAVWGMGSFNSAKGTGVWWLGGNCTWRGSLHLGRVP